MNSYLPEILRKMPINQATYEEYLSSIEPLLIKTERALDKSKNLTGSELFLHFKNNPLFVCSTEKNQTNRFLMMILRNCSSDNTILIIFAFLYLCKYDSEGLMKAYENLSFRLPTNFLRISGEKLELIMDKYHIEKVFEFIERNICMIYYESYARELEKNKEMEKVEELKKELNLLFSKGFSICGKEFLRDEPHQLSFERYCETLFPQLKETYLI